MQLSLIYIHGIVRLAVVKCYGGSELRLIIIHDGQTYGRHANSEAE